MLTCLMVAPSSTSTACFSFGVFTCTVIFPLPCIWIVSQFRQIQILEHQVGQHVSDQTASPPHLCSFRHGAACSAGRPALALQRKPLLSQSSQNSAQQVLSKLQPEWLCPICALINPGAAANAASRLGLSGTFSAHATSQVYTSFQDTTLLLRKLLSTKFCFKDNMIKGRLETDF